MVIDLQESDHTGELSAIGHCDCKGLQIYYPVDNTEALQCVQDTGRTFYDTGGRGRDRSWVLDSPLDSIKEVDDRRTLTKLPSIMDNPSHTCMRLWEF